MLNLAGCCNVLLNQNLAAEIIEIDSDRMQERQLFSISIAIRNASEDIQVFSKMFVSCYVHSFVSSEIAGPCMCNFKI